MNTSMRRAVAACSLLLALSAGSAAGADAENGKVLYEACAACHTERSDALGPSLKGVFGRKSAALEDFRTEAERLLAEKLGRITLADLAADFRRRYDEIGVTSHAV